MLLAAFGAQTGKAPVRWEVKASLMMLLAEVVCGNGAAAGAL